MGDRGGGDLLVMLALFSLASITLTPQVSSWYAIRMMIAMTAEITIADNAIRVSCPRIKFWAIFVPVELLEDD